MNTLDRTSDQHSSGLLTDIRTALRVDALASATLGVLLAALAGALDRLLGLPVALSVGVGAALVVWAALVAWIGRTARPAMVKEVAAVNAVWVVGSVVFLLLDPVGLTSLGTAFVVSQAVAVATLGGWQWAAVAAGATTSR